MNGKPVVGEEGRQRRGPRTFPWPSTYAAARASSVRLAVTPSDSNVLATCASTRRWSARFRRVEKLREVKERDFRLLRQPGCTRPNSELAEAVLPDVFARAQLGNPRNPRRDRQGIWSKLFAPPPGPLAEALRWAIGFASGAPPEDRGPARGPRLTCLDYLPVRAQRPAHGHGLAAADRPAAREAHPKEPLTGQQIAIPPAGRGRTAACLTFWTHL